MLLAGGNYTVPFTNLQNPFGSYWIALGIRKLTFNILPTRTILKMRTYGGTSNTNFLLYI